MRPRTVRRRTRCSCSCLGWRRRSQHGRGSSSTRPRPRTCQRHSRRTPSTMTHRRQPSRRPMRSPCRRRCPSSQQKSQEHSSHRRWFVRRSKTCRRRRASTQLKLLRHCSNRTCQVRNPGRREEIAPRIRPSTCQRHTDCIRSTLHSPLLSSRTQLRRRCTGPCPNWWCRCRPHRERRRRRREPRKRRRGRPDTPPWTSHPGLR